MKAKKLKPTTWNKSPPRKFVTGDDLRFIPDTVDPSTLTITNPTPRIRHRSSKDAKYDGRKDPARQAEIAAERPLGKAQLKKLLEPKS